MINLGKLWLAGDKLISVALCHKTTAAVVLGCSEQEAVSAALALGWVRVHSDSVECRSLRDLNVGLWHKVTGHYGPAETMYVDIVGKPRKMQDKKMTLSEITNNL
jgi:hypothetical protein